MIGNGRAALRGDEQELFRSLGKRLLRSVGRSVTAPEAIVEDACAFAWQRLLERQPERGERIFAWLRTVAIREAWRMGRRERAVTRLDEPSTGGAGPRLHEIVPDERASLEARLDVLEALRIVGGLPPRQRRLFALQIGGFTYAEAGALTGDSVRTVERQLRRADARVRDHSGER